jgi:hypothetical protein
MATIGKLTNRILEDATKDLILEVSPADIKGSRTKDPGHCVFANCAVRQLNADEALVFRSRAYIRFGNRWKRYEVSNAIAQELVVFDRGGKPQGGKFLLKKPSAANQLGNWRGEKTKLTKGRKTSPRVVFHRTSNVRIEASKGTLLLERLGV